MMELLFERVSDPRAGVLSVTQQCLAGFLSALELSPSLFLVPFSVILFWLMVQMFEQCISLGVMLGISQPNILSNWSPHLLLPKYLLNLSPFSPSPLLPGQILIFSCLDSWNSLLTGLLASSLTPSHHVHHLLDWCFKNTIQNRSL